MVELAVRQNPQFPYMEDHFDSIAPDIMSITNLPGEAYSIGLAPFGKVAKKYPLAGNEGAIGHDNMNKCQVHRALCGASGRESERVWYPGTRRAYVEEVAGASSDLAAR
jgi:hypothetical protein